MPTLIADGALGALGELGALDSPGELGVLLVPGAQPARIPQAIAMHRMIPIAFFISNISFLLFISCAHVNEPSDIFECKAFTQKCLWVFF